MYTQVSKLCRPTFTAIKFTDDTILWDQSEQKLWDQIGIKYVGMSIYYYYYPSVVIQTARDDQSHMPQQAPSIDYAPEKTSLSSPWARRDEMPPDPDKDKERMQTMQAKSDYYVHEWIGYSSVLVRRQLRP